MQESNTKQNVCCVVRVCVVCAAPGQHRDKKTETDKKNIWDNKKRDLGQNKKMTHGTKNMGPKVRGGGEESTVGGPNLERVRG